MYFAGCKAEGWSISEKSTTTWVEILVKSLPSVLSKIFCDAERLLHELVAGCFERGVLSLETLNALLESPES